MKKSMFVILLVFIIGNICLADDLENYYNMLLETDIKDKQNLYISEIENLHPQWTSVIELIQNHEYLEPSDKGILYLENMCIDGVLRPFNVYIPEHYNSTVRTPLIVYLHGGVGRENIIEEEEKEEFIAENPFTELAEKNGYIVLYPYGQITATWWDSVGYNNVLSQIKTLKQNFNIDDNRVYMTGFSDGGSGSFFFAMALATDFAGFIPLNGHPGVASINGELHTYFVNLSNSPLHVINTDLDPLYPAYDFKPAMDTAIIAGADLMYRIYTGICHDFTYAEDEMPRIENFMENHIRNPRPVKIVLESSDREFGRYMWLEIDSIDNTGHAQWYQDYNVDLVNRRLLFGFFHDQEFEGPGVRVADTVGEGTLCSVLGILPGDIFIECEGITIDDIEDLGEYKSTKERGDSTEIVILRDGEKITLLGKFSDPEIYTLLRRDLPSGRIEAFFCANEFHVKTSQVPAFSIYLDPEMVQLNQNVKVFVNDKLLFDQIIEPNIGFILNNYLENRDRSLLYVNKITIYLEPEKVR